MRAVSDGKGRIGTVFHETFPFSRTAVAEVLQVLQSNKVKTSLFDLLREHTALGTRYCKAMPRYAVASGLVEFGSYTLTKVGEEVVKTDPYLSQPATQWLLHYHLSAPHGPGPLFWHTLVTRFLQPGDTVDSKRVARWIATALLEAEEKEPTERALQSTATVFLGSYAHTEGLGALQMVKRTKNGYEVCQPDPPPVWVFAYALADFWEHHYPNQVTINLNSLSEPGGLTKIFWMDAGTLGRHLQTLKQEGVIDLYRVASPYQVVKLWDNPSALLERIYDRRSTEDD